VTKVNCPVLSSSSEAPSTLLQLRCVANISQGVETERHDGVTWQPIHTIPKTRENSFLSEGTDLTLLPLYTHPSVTPYQILLSYTNHGRTVPGSRILPVEFRYIRELTQPSVAVGLSTNVYSKLTKAIRIRFVPKSEHTVHLLEQFTSWNVLPSY
jgi:hypothetical protein